MIFKGEQKQLKLLPTPALTGIYILIQSRNDILGRGWDVTFDARVLYSCEKSVWNWMSTLPSRKPSVERSKVIDFYLLPKLLSLTELISKNPMTGKVT